MTKKRNLMAFEGEWLRCMGLPEMAGCWFVFGSSGNGKTSFVLQLCKYLTTFGRVAYNSMEEGDSESMRVAFMRADMHEVRKHIVLLDNEPIDELKERLKKHKAQKIVVIDSIQYSGLSYNEYKHLRNEFRDVLFIVISHADGKKPADRRAVSIQYDASVKVFVEGFRAYISSRYRTGEIEVYDIWPDKSKEFHLETLKNTK